MNPVDVWPNTSLEFRFWEKVRYIGADWRDCLEWDAALTGDGYGAIKIKGVDYLAHRVSYEWFYGVVPDTVDHRCKNAAGLSNRKCVNPWHLRSVPSRTNALENNTWFCAVNATKTHCPQGHEYTPENTRLKKQTHYDGWNRICRTCHSEYMKRWRAKKRAT